CVAPIISGVNAGITASTASEAILLQGVSQANIHDNQFSTYGGSPNIHGVKLIGCDSNSIHHNSFYHFSDAAINFDNSAGSGLNSINHNYCHESQYIAKGGTLAINNDFLDNKSWYSGAHSYTNYQVDAANRYDT